MDSLEICMPRINICRQSWFSGFQFTNSSSIVAYLSTKITLETDLDLVFYDGTITNEKATKLTKSFVGINHVWQITAKLQLFWYVKQIRFEIRAKNSSKTETEVWHWFYIVAQPTGKKLVKSPWVKSSPELDQRCLRLPGALAVYFWLRLLEKDLKLCRADGTLQNIVETAVKNY